VTVDDDPDEAPGSRSSADEPAAEDAQPATLRSGRDDGAPAGLGRSPSAWAHVAADHL